MPVKPVVTMDSTNRVPLFVEQNPDTSEWHGPVGIRDGEDVAAGKKADAAVTDPTASATRTSLLKGILQWLQGRFTAGQTIGKVDQGAAGASAWSVRAADGDLDTLGARNNAAANDSTSSWSVVSLLKGLLKPLLDVWNTTLHGLQTIGQAWATNTATLQNAAAAIGVGTPMDVSGMDTAVFTLTGPFVATVTFEASTDDANWFPMLATQLGAGTIGSTATAPGIYRAVVTGIKSVRANVTAYTSGAVTVKGRATPGDAPSKAVLASISASSVTLPTQAASEGSTGQAPPSKATLLGGIDPANGNMWGMKAGGADAQSGGTILEVVLAAINGSSQADRLRVDAQKNLLVGIRNSTGAEPGMSATTAASDNYGTSTTLLHTAAFEYLFNGIGFDRRRGANVFKAYGNPTLASATAGTVWTPAAGKKIRLMGISISGNTAGNVQLRMGPTGGGTVIWQTYLTASQLNVFVDFGQGRLALAANDVLEVFNNTGSQNWYMVTAWGTEE